MRTRYSYRCSNAFGCAADGLLTILATHLTWYRRVARFKMAASMDGSRSPENNLGGIAWLVAWAATCVFAIGAAVLVALLVLAPADPYGGAALLAVAICLLGVALFAVAGLAWLGRLLLNRPTSRRRAGLALATMGLAAASFVALIGDFVGAFILPAESWTIALAGMSFLVLGAILAADDSQRQPVLAFGLTWVLLTSIIAYRLGTDLRVEVVWLGPTTASRTSAQIAFSATRSGDFEVRFGAHSCFEGRVIASGHYAWRAGDRGSFGADAWIDLPDDVQPLRQGDLIRVCLRDGLAAGTAAGEVVDPPSFWPRR
jgi:MFS family permease